MAIEIVDLPIKHFHRFLYVYQRVNPDTVHGDNITSSAEVLRGSSSFASEAYPPSHLAPRDTTSEFFWHPQKSKISIETFHHHHHRHHHHQCYIKGLAISIPSPAPAPAPSPTLHRVLVEQILSADDFLIFKVGRRDFWL